MLRGGHKGTKALPTIACHLAFTQSAEINRAPQVSSLYERRRQSARLLRGEFFISVVWLRNFTSRSHFKSKHQNVQVSKQIGNDRHTSQICRPAGAADHI